MKQVYWNEYLVTIVEINGVVLQHKGISSL